MIIAIDGYSSTGKSSVSKKIAEILGLTHLDTGAMFRLITYFAIRNCLTNSQLNVSKLIENLENIPFEYKIQNHQFVFYFEGKNIEEFIRNPDIGKWVSPVAMILEVRTHLLNLQRKIAEKGNIIMDGRDIGTVVLPNADFKFFLTASLEQRSKRRYLELKASGKDLPLESVMENLKTRDTIDSTRQIAPLIPAKDAILVDNTHMDKQQTIEFIINKVRC